MTKRSTRRPAIITALDPVAELCPDLAEWPQRWSYEDSDLPCGQELVVLFTPFLLALINQGLARRTLVRHRDNLWMLGGEIIRIRQGDRRQRRLPTAQLLRALLDSDGGPILSSSFHPDDQATFDATCRKYHRFLADQVATTSRA